MITMSSIDMCQRRDKITGTPSQTASSIANRINTFLLHSVNKNRALLKSCCVNSRHIVTIVPHQCWSEWKQSYPTCEWCHIFCYLKQGAVYSAHLFTYSSSDWRLQAYRGKDNEESILFKQHYDCQCWARWLCLKMPHVQQEQRQCSCLTHCKVIQQCLIVILRHVVTVKQLHDGHS